ncbi:MULTISPECIES: hypothetical protein [unclassified Cryobacterium]|uniref:hypothetical protein n=1 Tax=unclassified Cryobacterium TaxID=2649013 RepID=UPI002AB39C1C|nr:MULTISPECIES: hypothetical protein [unclassified Cryobacterium]MDY7541174.1 hypothetical protein [Cryobacterium sp. 5B3]MEA9998924.1 hypothetical protein [Cryobacterium sp. RTS3]MEB0267079.1 hypothetical protein [Cryobacterium sp. 10I5]MEB0274255.1 hypothetical protein [Cryobacterium sp. 5B3]
MPQQEHPTDNVIDLAARRADREAKRPAAPRSGYGEWRAEVRRAREAAASEAYAESLRESGGIRSVGRGRHTWHEIPQERRTDWQRVQCGIAPRALGDLRVEPRWSEHTDLDWVRVALGFEDSGFTPTEYFRLRQALHAELLVPDAAPKLGTARRRRQLKATPMLRPHPLVTVEATPRSSVRVLIEASDWAPWLGLVRSGLTPRAAVRQLLGPPQP